LSSLIGTRNFVSGDRNIKSPTLKVQAFRPYELNSRSQPEK